MVSNVFVETIDNDNEVVALAQHEIMWFLTYFVENLDEFLTANNSKLQDQYVNDDNIIYFFSFSVTTYKFLKLQYYLREVQDS